MQISQRVDGNLLTRQARRRTADGRNRVRPYSFCQLSSYRPIAAPSMWRSSLRTLPMGGQLRRQSRRRLGRRTPETAQRGFDCTQGDERLGLLYRSRDRIDDRYADLIPRAGRLPSTTLAPDDGASRPATIGRSVPLPQPHGPNADQGFDERLHARGPCLMRSSMSTRFPIRLTKGVDDRRALRIDEILASGLGEDQ
jgi:hypothetical protein